MGSGAELDFPGGAEDAAGFRVPLPKTNIF